MIRTVCPCGAKLKVGDDLAGKSVRCPKCGNSLPVPTPEPIAELDDEPPQDGPLLPFAGDSEPRRSGGASVWVGVGIFLALAAVVGVVAVALFIGDDPGSPTAQVAAFELWNAYETNAAGADAAYKGKTLAVTGTAFVITSDYVGQPFRVDQAPVFERPEQSYNRVAAAALSMGSRPADVIFRFNGASKDVVAKLRPQDAFVAVGVCKGRDREGRIVLERCRIKLPVPETKKKK